VCPNDDDSEYSNGNYLSGGAGGARRGARGGGGGTEPSTGRSDKPEWSAMYHEQQQQHDEQHPVQSKCVSQRGLQKCVYVERGDGFHRVYGDGFGSHRYGRVRGDNNP